MPERIRTVGASPGRKPTDQAVRDRVVSDFDTTLLLEAGAGSGKTTVLVSRILAILRSGRAPIDRVVAITFTEKAAGELKARLRDEIERAHRDRDGRRSRAAGPGARRSRARAGLDHPRLRRGCSCGSGPSRPASIPVSPSPPRSPATAPSTTPGRPGCRTGWARATPSWCVPWPAT